MIYHSGSCFIGYKLGENRYRRIRSNIPQPGQPPGIPDIIMEIMKTSRATITLKRSIPETGLILNFSCTQLFNRKLILSSPSLSRAAFSSPHFLQPGHEWSTFENPKSIIFRNQDHLFRNTFRGATSLCSTPKKWMQYSSPNRISLT
jgi:hypothetical protein